MARNYSSQAVGTTLAAVMNSSQTTLQVAALVGFPTTTPFTITIDKDGDSPEIVDVTDVSGTTLTIVRHVDNSVAVEHSAGDTVEHTATARDFQESADHIDTVTGVHGTTSAIVGVDDPQTLTQKVIDASLNTITNVGTAELEDGGVTDAKIAGMDGSKLTGTVNAAKVAGHSVFIQSATPTALATNDVWIW